jgi:hypothetical protein
VFTIDYNAPFNVSVDASNYAASGILLQTNDNWIEKPIAFTSQKLMDAQTRAQSTTEKEAFAVINILRKYHDWLFRVNVHPDHHSLLYWTDAAVKSPLLT